MQALQVYKTDKKEVGDLQFLEIDKARDYGVLLEGKPSHR
jgi:hypothetical protein